MLRKHAAIALILPLSLCAPAAADEIDDIVRAVAAAGHDTPTSALLRDACNTDSLCAARFLRDRIGDGAQLVPATGTQKKPRGWSQRPALHYVLNDTRGRLIVAPARYDDAAAEAVQKALAEAPGAGTPIDKVVIDVRKIDDAGNLDGMRRLAAYFIGRQDRAFSYLHSTGRAIDWTVPKPPQQVAPVALEVWTDADIGAEAEAFAALLRVHAGAKVLGTVSHARGYVAETVPVSPGWALKIPTGRISVAGDVLSDGLIPDGPLSE
jgi:hypothetical protein